MAETKRGRLAVKALAIKTDEIIYSVADGSDATVDICVANMGAAPAIISLAVSDDAAVVEDELTGLESEDYIRGRTVIEIGDALEIKGLKMSEGEALVANSSRAGVSVRVSGFEEGVIAAG